MKVIFFLGAFLSLFANPCGASDILDILGAQDTEIKVSVNRDLTHSLRKLFKNPNAEQNIFFSFLGEAEYEKSFYQWNSAFEKTAFVKSPTGQALKAFLLYKLGLGINGLEMLASTPHPQKINKELLSFWKVAAPFQSPFWILSDFKWNEFWGQTFGRQVEVRVGNRTVHGAENFKVIVDLLRKANPHTEEKAWLEWQLALKFALDGDLGKGAKVLSFLMKESKNFIDKNLMTITAARMLYAEGFLEAAIKYYKKVAKKSDYWFVAQEEMAWSYLRRGEPQNSLAVTKSLVQPGFKALIGPETVFLKALSQLKICDYKAASKSLLDYKNFFKQKAINLQSLKTGESDAIEFFFGVLDKKGRTPLVKLKKRAYELPRYITRDEVLYRLSQRAFALEKESESAAELYKKSLSGGTAEVGFQKSVNDIKVRIENKFQTAKNAFYSRVKDLASDEIEEIHQILQKMHIIEAEILQQVTVLSSVTQSSYNKVLPKKVFDSKKGTTGSEARDTLKFLESREIWFDEISNFRIDVKKGCEVSKKE